MITYRSDDLTNLGGQTFAFTEQFDQWFIRSSKLDEVPEKQYTLEWLSDDHHSALAVQKNGRMLTTEEYLEATGLQIHGSTLKHSKRLRRVTGRPYFLQGQIKDLRLKVDERLDLKVWDGAGRVSRSFLYAMIKRQPLPSFVRRVFKRLVKTVSRVEFTVLNAEGQYKGHAVVVDTTEYDLMVPKDPKREIALQGMPWVGINFLGHSDELWLDLQSFINMVPFWDHNLLHKWLDDAGARALADIREERWEKQFASYVPEDPQAWTLAEYLSLGGKLMWFRSMAKMAASQHIRKVDARKPRVPIPGKRYYVFVDEVVGIQVTPGCAQIVNDNLVVSKQDWQRLSEDWEGADQDDALCVVLYVDSETGEHTVLAWRNPNDVGAYVKLSPEGAQWESFDRPVLSGSKLPKRPDRKYQDKCVRLPKIEGADVYSIENVRRYAQLLNARLGILGRYINILMCLKAHEWEVEWYPLPLETLIDELVMAKHGIDLSPVRDWIATVRSKLQKMPLAHALWERVGKEAGEPAKDHWLDQHIARINRHLESYELKVNTLLSEVAPPAQVFIAAGRKLRYMDIAGQLNNAWTKAIQATPAGEEPDWAAIRAALAELLSHAEVDGQPLQREEWMWVMACVFARIYVINRDRSVKSDASAWIPNLTARATIELLQRLKLIGEFIETDAGTIMVHDSEVEPVRSSFLRVGAVHFQNYQRDELKKGHVVKFVSLNSSIPAEEAVKYKAEIVTKAAEGVYTGVMLRAVREDTSYTVWARQGGQAVKLGYLKQPLDHDITTLAAFPDDGNLFVVYL